VFYLGASLQVFFFFFFLNFLISLTLFICVLHSTILLLATTSDCLSYALHFPSFSGWNNFFGVHAN